MDVNGDGQDDLVYLAFRTPADGIQVNTWFSNGDGSWRLVPRNVLSGQAFFENRFNVANLGARLMSTGTASIDLVHLDQTAGALSIRTLISNGDGTWLEPIVDEPLDPWTASDTLNWRFADANGDGKGDLIYFEYLKPGIRIYTLLSQGNGAWVQARSSPVEVWKNV